MGSTMRSLGGPPGLWAYMRKSQGLRVRAGEQKKEKKSSSARSRNLLKLYNRSPSGAKQRALTLARVRAHSVVSEPQAHGELGCHLCFPRS
jgi:hypothetical protein